MSCQTFDAGRESCSMILRCVLGRRNIYSICSMYLSFFSVAAASDQQHIITLSCLSLVFTVLLVDHLIVHCEEQFILWKLMIY